MDKKLIWLDLFIYFLAVNFNFFYYKKQNFKEDDNVLAIKRLQSDSTIIALSNYQINKLYGPSITSTMNSVNFKDIIKPESKSVSVIYLTIFNLKLEY
jgi:hypothetical protein